MTIRRGTPRRLGLRAPTVRQWDTPLSEQSWFAQSWRPAPGYERAYSPDDGRAAPLALERPSMTDNDDRPLFASDKVTVPDFSTWNPQLGGFLVPQAIRDEVMSLAMGTTMLGRVAAMTPEERAAVEQQRRAALDGIAAAHAQLLADVDELAAEILLLHAPQLDNLVTCSGCDFSGYEGEPPEWPCRTYVVVAKRNGRQFVGEFEPYGPRMEVRT